MTNSFKRKSDLHVARKIWHFCGVMAMVGLYLVLSRPTAIQLITLVACLAVVSDVLRQQIPALNAALTSVFKPVMREHERSGLAGTTYLMLGSFIIILLFPRNIVTLSLLFLAVADPLASYVGIRYGKDKILGQKSLQGTVAAFLACFAIAAVYFFVVNLMTERLLIVSVLAGLIGALSELIPIGKIDDNFTFPVVSSSLLYFLFYLFGGF